MVVLGWSCALSVMGFFVWWWRWFLPPDVVERSREDLLLKRLSSWDQLTKQKTALIHCSSAGEYEQALPLAAALKGRGVVAVFCFFSPSALLFVEKTGCLYPYILAPWDRLSLCRKVLEYINPVAVWVVRYELWPSFLMAARERGKVYLINVSVDSDLRRWRRVLLRFFYSFFHNIYTRTPEDQERVQELLGDRYSQIKVICTGDTKYERVLQRKDQSQLVPSLWKNIWRKNYGHRPTLVLGSCWMADIELITEALQKEGGLPDLVVHLVPHKVDESSLSAIKNYLNSRSITTQMFSSRRAGLHKNHSQGLTYVLCEELGVLFDLYSTAHMCWVGGGCHHRVHNVLEPLVFGVPVAFGPFHSTSYEAVDLIQKGLAWSLSTPSEVRRWVLDMMERTEEQKERYKTEVHTQVFRGHLATEKILEHSEVL